MRLRWYSTLGSGAAGVVVIALAALYLELPSSAGVPPRGLGDPLFLIAVLAVAAAGGLAGGAFLDRPLRDLAQAVRQTDTAGQVRLTPPAVTTTEVVELFRAVNDLQTRQAEMALGLRGEKERLEVILDSITEGLLVTDGSGRIVMANRALRDLYAVSRPLAGRRPVEVVRNAAVGDAVERVLVGAGPVSCEITLGAGALRHLEVQVAPIAATGVPDGAPVGTVTVFYEITRLRRLERMRADFVANVSHELRTPLTAIKGCAETLADGALADPEAGRRFVGVIASHADRLTVLLSDLLDLARLESEQVSIEPSPVLLQRIVDTARDAVTTQAAERDIEIVDEIPAGLQALCDRRLIEHALINLVDNAVKYTPEGGRLRITARRVARPAAILELGRRRWSAGGVEMVPADDEEGADAIVVEVADNGIGIPSTEVERVFERFYRVDKGRSRAMGGTGLGLSIVRHVIDLHGERVFVDSTLGSGSVFGFTLPAA